MKAIEAEIEDDVKDICNAFEDSKNEFEDATVNIKEDERGGRVSLSRKPISLSREA